MDIVPLSDHMSFIDEIAQLHQAEWAHLDKNLTFELRRKSLIQAARKEGIPSIYVAIENGEFIGSAAIVEHDLDTHLELGPWISAVFVKKQWRMLGIATKLVARCETEAKKAHAQKFYLSTEFASDLYKKLGWHTIEKCMYKGVKLDVMCKTIAS